MKLFTKDIDRHLFKQYHLGSDLENQVVVAKIFNPYQNMRWFLINSDVDDSDYIWAIVQMGNNVEVGSVSRSELETIRISPFRLPLERDLGFRPVNAQELLNGLRQGKFYKKGGFVDNENKEMVENQATEVKHHSEELSNALKNTDHVDAWVVGKMERATTDLSDVTHYLDGESKKMADGGMIDKLVGKHIDIYTEGVKEPMTEKIISSRLTPSQYTHRDLILEIKGGGEERIPISKLDDFLNHKQIHLKDSKGEDYAISLNKKYADGGMMADGGSVEKIKEGDYFIVLKGMKIKRFRIYSIDGDDVKINYSTSGKEIASVYSQMSLEGDIKWMLKNGYIKKTNEKEYWKDKYKNIFADGGMMADGGKIKNGDVVIVKEPNYGYDDSYYVVSNKGGYDKNGFLISPTRARLGDVFEEEQLSKLYADGGMMAKGGELKDIERDAIKLSKIYGKIYLLQRQGGGHDGEYVLATEEELMDELNSKYNSRFIQLYGNGKKYADGGKIKDQYKDRKPEDIWNNLSKEQKQHFIYDHKNEIETYRGEEYGELSGKEIIKAYNSEYKDLDKNIKNRFDNHTREGQYADGGEVNKYAEVFDKLKKGDKVKMTFGSGISKQNKAELIVKSKNIVGKGKSYESEKITFENIRNPKGIKFYAYKRKSGYVGFAMGDLAISDVQISFEDKMAYGGGVAKYSIIIDEDWDEPKNYKSFELSKKWIYENYKNHDSLELVDQFGDSIRVSKEDDKKDLDWLFSDKMADGGMSNKKVTFDDKVKAIQSSLLKRKKVSPKVQKEYGKTYNKKEALQSAKRIVGAMRKKGK
jgi:hypothetical protein